MTLLIAIVVALMTSVLVYYLAPAQSKRARITQSVMATVGLTALVYFYYLGERVLEGQAKLSGRLDSRSVRLFSIEEELRQLRRLVGDIVPFDGLDSRLQESIAGLVHEVDELPSPTIVPLRAYLEREVKRLASVVEEKTVDLNDQEVVQMASSLLRSCGHGAVAVNRTALEESLTTMEYSTANKYAAQRGKVIFRFYFVPENAERAEFVRKVGEYRENTGEAVSVVIDPLDKRLPGSLVGKIKRLSALDALLLDGTVLLCSPARRDPLVVSHRLDWSESDSWTGRWTPAAFKELAMQIVTALVREASDGMPSWLYLNPDTDGVSQKDVDWGRLQDCFKAAAYRHTQRTIINAASQRRILEEMTESLQSTPR